MPVPKEMILRMRWTLFGIAFLLLAAGCGGSKSVRSTTPAVTRPTSSTVTTTGRFHYPPVLVRTYIRSCLNEGAVKRAYCACTLDKLSNNVSTADFMRIGLARGRIPPRIKRLMTRAALDCSDKL